MAVRDPIAFLPAPSWLSAIFDLLGPTELTADLESPGNAGKTSMGKRSISDVFLFFQVLFFAAAVPFLLRLKLSRVEVLLEPRISSPPERNRVARITEYIEMAMRQGRPLVRPGCLTRGVTRYYFLRRDGMEVSLCFGMGQVDGEFAGHCWLVKDGVPFMETWDPRLFYSEMYRFSGTARRSSIPSGKNELEQSRS